MAGLAIITEACIGVKDRACVDVFRESPTALRPARRAALTTTSRASARLTVRTVRAARTEPVLTTTSVKLAEFSAARPTREDEELPAAPEPQEPEQVPKV